LNQIPGCSSRKPGSQLIHIQDREFDSGIAMQVKAWPFWLLRLAVKQPEVADFFQADAIGLFFEAFIKSDGALTELTIHRRRKHVSKRRGASGRISLPRAIEPLDYEKIEAGVVLQQMIGAGQTQNAGPDDDDPMTPSLRSPVQRLLIKTNAFLG
jgi:hypothetical protein